MKPSDPTSFDTETQSLLNVALGRCQEEGDMFTLEAFERALFGSLMELGRAVMVCLFGLVDSRDSIEENGVVWRAKERVPKRYMTRFGSVVISRWVHQRVRNGITRAFIEERLGIVMGFLTPLSAKLSVALCADMTTRDAALFFKLLGAMEPSRSTLQRLVGATGTAWEEHRLEIEAIQRRAFEAPEAATTVAVMLDGVMLHMVASRREKLKESARAEGRKVGGPIGDKEASGGVFVLYDAEGKRLHTKRFSRMPESDKNTLKETLRQELQHLRSCRPDIRVVAISDGAPNNWSFLESLDPDFQIVDFYHTVEHIKRRLDHALTPGTHENQRHLKRLRRLLRDQPDGHRAAFEQLTDIEKRAGTFKERKASGRGAQPTYYERHAGRMDYAGFLAQNLPIGSGVIEGTVRHIVVDRLRRTGMRWSQAGGQAVLTIRCAIKNRDFETGWDYLVGLRSLARTPGAGSVMAA